MINYTNPKKPKIFNIRAKCSGCAKCVHCTDKKNPSYIFFPIKERGKDEDGYPNPMKTIKIEATIFHLKDGSIILGGIGCRVIFNSVFLYGGITGSEAYKVFKRVVKYNIPDFDLSRKFCFICSKIVPVKCMKRCSACRNAYYCSKECQITDWKEHKNECKSWFRCDYCKKTHNSPLVLSKQFKDSDKIYHFCDLECAKKFKK